MSLTVTYLAIGVFLINMFVAWGVTWRGTNLIGQPLFAADIATVTEGAEEPAAAAFDPRRLASQTPNENALSLIHI